MDIQINNTTKNKINTKILKKAGDAFGKKMRVDGKEVSVAFVSPQKIRQLNKIYRKIDKVTDVLSFIDNEGGKFLGEVVICYNQIRKQAKSSGFPIQKELVFIFIHGLLHLLGYDDKTEKGRGEMEKLGVELSQKIIKN